jgi:ribonuclease P protein component
MERLKRRSDFLAAAAAGTRTTGGAFVLQARLRPDQGAVRVGFTVSRQVGNAVERNRVRRRLRELVRLAAREPACQLRPGYDYVLIGRRTALELPFGRMMQELDAALGRIHSAKPKGTGGPTARPPHEAGSPALPRSQTGRKARRSPPKRER